MAKLPLIDTCPVKDKPVRGAKKKHAPADRTAIRPSKRAVGATERRAAIIAAGLDEFTARGFAATRLDDVAKRAGVAKGTIYLHFKDKEALFQELVRTALGPLIVRISNPRLGRVQDRRGRRWKHWPRRSPATSSAQNALTSCE